MKGLNKKNRKNIYLKQLFYAIINFLIIAVMLSIAIAVYSYYTNVVFYRDSDKYIMSNCIKLAEQGYMVGIGDADRYPSLSIVYFDKDGKVIPRGKAGIYYFDEKYLENFINSNVGDKDENHVFFYDINHHTYRSYVMPHVSGGYVATFMDVDQIIYINDKVKNEVGLIVFGLLLIGFLISAGLSVLQVLPYRRRITKINYFTSNMTHEIGTPLAVIKAHLQSLMSTDYALENEEVMSKLSSALGEVNRLKKMGEELLVLTRVDNNNLNVKLSDVVLEKELAEIIEASSMMAELEEKYLSMTVVGVSREVRCDFDKIKQCVLALIDNAIKYTNEGANITVKIQYNANNYSISVADDGPGVSLEDLPHIFDRFYRCGGEDNEKKGSGLGLSIVSGIVMSLGGSVVGSIVNPHGLKVTMTLPYKDNEKKLSKFLNK